MPRPGWWAGATEGRTTAAAIAALAVVMGLAIWPLLTGAAKPTWDAAAFSAPAVGLVADFARAGELLTWNPWLGGGRPDCADPSVGAASPVVIAAGLIGGPKLGGFLLYWLGSWFLGGVGVLVLARALGAPPWSRLVGAAAFVACGFFTGHGQHTTFVFAYATLPWFVWCLDRAVAGRSWAAALQAGAIWGLAGLSGYPGMVIAHGLYGGAWALGRALFGGLAGARGDVGSDRRRLGERFRRLGRLAILGALVLSAAVVVMAPTYVAFFVEGRESTARVAPLSRYWVVERGALTPSGLTTFASPNLLRLELEHTGKLIRGDISMQGIYLAPVVVALAAVAVLGAGRSRWRWWLLAVGAVAFAAALGPLLPVRAWLFELVPPTRYFRFSALFRGYAMFTVLMLALEAARDIDWRRSRRHWLTFAAASAALGTLALWTVRGAVEKASIPLELGGWVGWMLLAWFGPAAVGLAGALGPTTCRRAAPALLVALATVDAASALRLAEPLWATRVPHQLRIWEAVAREHRAAVDRLPGGLDRVLRAPLGVSDNRNLAAKLAIFDAYDPFRDRYHLAWTKNEPLVELVTGTDRIWFGERALLVEPVPPPPGSGDLKLLEIPTPDLDLFARRALAVGGLLPVLHRVQGRPLDGPLLDRGAMEELPAMRRLPATLLEASPRTLGLRVQAPSAGWLVVTDRYAPGWRATVDGRPMPIHKAAFLFRGVAIGPGTHDVRFEFRPFGYRTLVVASWSLLLAACFAGRLPALRGRHRQIECRPIELTDFERQWVDIGDAALDAARRVGESGRYVLGSEVEAFERALADAVGAHHAVGCASGLDAIEIALRATGAKPGDRVLTTPLSAFATTLAILRAECVAVFADVDDSGLLDLGRCESIVAGGGIRFVLPVHLFGHALDLDRLADLRARHGVVVIEDFAQAIGASFRGRRAGTVGDASALSLYPTKNLGALGDGGVLVTDDAAIRDRARSLRDYGQTAKYVHDHRGLNSRLDEMQAAILRRASLPHLATWTARRREIAGAFLRGIANPRVRPVPPPDGSASVWHLFPVLVDDREAFRRHLEAGGVRSGVHYPRLITEQKALGGHGAREIVGELCNAARFAASEVSLPIHPYLTPAEVERIVELVNGWSPP